MTILRCLSVRPSFGPVFLENAGNYTRSIIYALDAESAALEINSPLWLARIYELIADLQEESYNVPEAIKYRKKSIDYYKKSDYEFLSSWMSVDLANAYYEMHDSINYVKSIHLLDSVMDVCKDSVYSDYFFGHLYTSYLGPLYALSEYDIAIMKFRELQKLYPDYEISSQSYSYIGRCFIEINLDSAEFYYRKSLTAHSQSKLSEYITLYNILIKQRDFEKALDIKNKISFIDDSIATYQVRQSLALAQSDYFAIMAKKEHRIARRHKAFLIFGSLFSGIIIFIVCLFYRERVLRKNAELSEWVGKFEDVSADFNKANSINKKLRITLEDIRKEAAVVSSELNEHKTESR